MSMIKQAIDEDIPVIEKILLGAVEWMDKSGLHQWEADQVRWNVISKYFVASDFYIAYEDGNPAACIAIVDYDPNFWENIPKGESLYIHKVAVVRDYAGKGYSKKLIDFAKEKARSLGIKTIRLDCHRSRAKVRAIYEREGFVCVEEKTLFGRYETAFYVCNV